jgi:hypothetical protein
LRIWWGEKKPATCRPFGRGIVGVAGIAELLADAEAGIDIERLHQIDDRGSPFQLLLFGGDRLIQDGGNVHGLRQVQPAGVCLPMQNAGAAKPGGNRTAVAQ